MPFNEYGEPIKEALPVTDLTAAPAPIDAISSESVPPEVIADRYFDFMYGRNQDPRDFTEKYNTQLDPVDEQKFGAWMEALSSRDSRDLSGDTYDYDLRGLYRYMGGMLPEAGHMPDTFKKPNHPTFSNESAYNGLDGFNGGSWENGKFIVGDSNLHSPDELRDYFSKAEPDTVLYDRRVNTDKTSDIISLIDKGGETGKVMSDAAAFEQSRQKGKQTIGEVIKQKLDMEGGDNVIMKSALMFAGAAIGGILVSAFAPGLVAGTAITGGLLKGASIARGVAQTIGLMFGSGGAEWISSKENRDVRSSILRLKADAYGSDEERNADKTILGNWYNEKRIEDMRGQPGFLGLTIGTLIDQIPYALAEWGVGGAATRSIVRGSFQRAVKGVAKDGAEELLRGGTLEITPGIAKIMLEKAAKQVDEGLFASMDKAVLPQLQRFYETRANQFLRSTGGKIGATAGMQTLISTPRVLSDVQSKELNDIHVDETGNLAVGKSTAGDYSKAFASSYIESLTEVVGSDIAKKIFFAEPIKKAFGGMLADIPEGALKKGVGTAARLFNTDAGKLLTGRSKILSAILPTSHFGSSIEEFSEEYVSMVAQAALGLDSDERGDKSYAFNLLDKTLFPATHPIETAAMLTAFGIMPAAAKGFSALRGDEMKAQFEDSVNAAAKILNWNKENPGGAINTRTEEQYLQLLDQATSSPGIRLAVMNGKKPKQGDGNPFIGLIKGMFAPKATDAILSQLGFESRQSFADKVAVYQKQIEADTELKGDEAEKQAIRNVISDGLIGSVILKSGDKDAFNQFVKETKAEVVPGRYQISTSESGATTIQPKVIVKSEALENASEASQKIAAANSKNILLQDKPGQTVNSAGREVDRKLIDAVNSATDDKARAKAEADLTEHLKKNLGETRYNEMSVRDKKIAMLIQKVEAAQTGKEKEDKIKSLGEALKPHIRKNEHTDLLAAIDAFAISADGTAREEARKKLLGFIGYRVKGFGRSESRNTLEHNRQMAGLAKEIAENAKSNPDQRIFLDTDRTTYASTKEEAEAISKERGTKTEVGMLNNARAWNYRKDGVGNIHITPMGADASVIEEERQELNFAENNNGKRELKPSANKALQAISRDVAMAVEELDEKDPENKKRASAHNQFAVSVNSALKAGGSQAFEAYGKILRALYGKYSDSHAQIYQEILGSLTPETIALFEDSAMEVHDERSQLKLPWHRKVQAAKYTRSTAGVEAVKKFLGSKKDPKQSAETKQEAISVLREKLGAKEYEDPDQKALAEMVLEELENARGNQKKPERKVRAAVQQIHDAFPDITYSSSVESPDGFEFEEVGETAEDVTAGSDTEEEAATKRTVAEELERLSFFKAIVEKKGVRNGWRYAMMIAKDDFLAKAVKNETSWQKFMAAGDGTPMAQEFRNIAKEASLGRREAFGFFRYRNSLHVMPVLTIQRDGTTIIKNRVDVAVEMHTHLTALFDNIDDPKAFVGEYIYAAESANPEDRYNFIARILDVPSELIKQMDAMAEKDKNGGTVFSRVFSKAKDLTAKIAAAGNADEFAKQQLAEIRNNFGAVIKTPDGKVKSSSGALGATASLMEQAGYSTIARHTPNYRNVVGKKATAVIGDAYINQILKVINDKVWAGKDFQEGFAFTLDGARTEDGDVEGSDLHGDSLYKAMLDVFTDSVKKSSGDEKPSFLMHMGRFGEKGAHFFVRMPLRTDAQLQASAEKMAKIRDQWSPEAKAMYADPVELYNQIKAERNGKPFTNADRMEMHYANGHIFVAPYIYGDLADYVKKGSSPIQNIFNAVKRNSQTITPGLAYSKPVNVMYIDDLSNSQTGEAFDGMAFLMPEFAEEAAADFGEELMRDLKSADTLKAHISVVLNGRRVLVKVNNSNLKMLAEAGLEDLAKLYEYASNWNEKHPENPIQMIAPKSGAKFRGGSALTDYKAGKDPVIQTLPEGSLIRSQWLNHPSEVNHEGIIAKQRAAHMFAGFMPHGRLAAQLRNEVSLSKVEDEAALSERLQDKKLISDSSPEKIIQAVERGESLFDPRYYEFYFNQVMSVERKMLRPLSARVALQKIGEGNLGLSGYRSQEEQIDDEAKALGIEGNEKAMRELIAAYNERNPKHYVRLPRLNANIRGARYNTYGPSKDDKFQSHAEAVEFIREHAIQFNDMFEPDENGMPSKDVVLEHEIEYKNGGWVIPGEPVEETRVPSENYTSHGFARLNEPATPKEYRSLNLSMSPDGIRIAKGEDFDGDKGFVLMFYKRRQNLESDSFGFDYQGGIYRTAADEKDRIVWSSLNDENVWEPVKDKALLAKLDEEFPETHFYYSAYDMDRDDGRAESSRSKMNRALNLEMLDWINPRMLEYYVVKGDIPINTFDSIVDARREEIGHSAQEIHLNTPGGIAFHASVNYGSRKAIGVAAVYNSMYSILSGSDEQISFNREKEIYNKRGKLVRKVKLSGLELDGLVIPETLDFKNYRSVKRMINVLMTIIIDDPKDPRAYYLNLSRETGGPAIWLMMNNVKHNDIGLMQENYSTPITVGSASYVKEAGKWLDAKTRQETDDGKLIARLELMTTKAYADADRVMRFVASPAMRAYAEYKEQRLADDTGRMERVDEYLNRLGFELEAEFINALHEIGNGLFNFTAITNAVYSKPDGVSGYQKLAAAFVSLETGFDDLMPADEAQRLFGKYSENQAVVLSHKAFEMTRQAAKRLPVAQIAPIEDMEPVHITGFNKLIAIGAITGNKVTREVLAKAHDDARAALKAHADNLFVRKLRISVKGLIELNDATRVQSNIEYAANTIEAIKAAFAELPENVQQAFAVNVILERGLTADHISGSYLDLISDKLSMKLNSGVKASTKALAAEAKLQSTGKNVWSLAQLAAEYQQEEAKIPEAEANEEADAKAQLSAMKAEKKEAPVIKQEPEAPAAEAEPQAPEVNYSSVPADSLAHRRKDGVIEYNEEAITADWNSGLLYLQGKSSMPGSRQKLVVFDGIDLSKLRAALKTRDGYKQFIRVHEEAHGERGDDEVYTKLKAGNPGMAKEERWMLPEAIAAERGANELAFKKMGIDIESLKLPPKVSYNSESIMQAYNNGAYVEFKGNAPALKTFHDLHRERIKAVADADYPPAELAKLLVETTDRLPERIFERVADAMGFTPKMIRDLTYGEREKLRKASYKQNLEESIGKIAEKKEHQAFLERIKAWKAEKNLVNQLELPDAMLRTLRKLGILDKESTGSRVHYERLLRDISAIKPSEKDATIGYNHIPDDGTAAKLLKIGTDKPLYLLKTKEILLTKDEADKLLALDTEELVKEAYSILPDFDALPGALQSEVIQDLDSVRKFSAETLGAISSGRYLDAARSHIREYIQSSKTPKAIFGITGRSLINALIENGAYIDSLKALANDKAPSVFLKEGRNVNGPMEAIAYVFERGLRDQFEELGFSEDSAFRMAYRTLEGSAIEQMYGLEYLDLKFGDHQLNSQASRVVRTANSVPTKHDLGEEPGEPTYTEQAYNSMTGYIIEDMARRNFTLPDAARGMQNALLDGSRTLRVFQHMARIDRNNMLRETGGATFIDKDGKSHIANAESRAEGEKYRQAITILMETPEEKWETDALIFKVLEDGDIAPDKMSLIETKLIYKYVRWLKETYPQRLDQKAERMTEGLSMLKQFATDVERNYRGVNRQHLYQMTKFIFSSKANTDLLHAQFKTRELVEGYANWLNQNKPTKAMDVVRSYEKWRAEKAAYLPAFDGANTMQRYRDMFDRQEQYINSVAATFGDEWIAYWGKTGYVPHLYQDLRDWESSFAPPPSETSTHEKKRFYESYKDAFQAGKVPQTLDIATLYGKYSTSLETLLNHRATISAMALSLDSDGMPMILFDDINSMGIVTENVAGQLADQVVEAYRSIDPAKKFAGLTAYQDGFKRLSIVKGQISMKELGYEHVATNFKSNENVWVKAGTPVKIANHIFNMDKKAFKNKYAQKLFDLIQSFNHLTKVMGLAISAFHFFSLAESVIAQEGISGHDGKGNLLLHPLKTMKQMRDIFRSTIMDVDYTSEWIDAGLMFESGGAPDYYRRYEYDNDKLVGLGRKMLKSKNPLAKPIGLAMETAGKLKSLNDGFLWEVALPSMKMFTVNNLYAKYKAEHMEKFNRPMTPAEDRKLREDIAGYMNDSIGGQEWEQYTWANPSVRRWLHLFIFAPDWTLSALNMSGVTHLGPVRKLVGAPTSLIHSQQRMEVYWPAMAAIILGVVPNIMQAMVFALAKAMGGDDDEAKPFAFMNEPGEELSVDMTPLFTLMGLKYGKTENRRVYLRWGKQSYEVFEGWLGGPKKAFSTLLGKSSSAVKFVMEQGLGEYMPGWKTPWADKSFMGSVVAVDGKVWDGRLAGVLKKFMPMSITPFFDEWSTPSSGKPTSFFAPARLGMSSYRAAEEIASVMRIYAEGGLKADIAGVPNFEKNLDVLVEDILGAAVLNGYDRKKILGQGIAKARTFYYGRFFESFQKENIKAMEQTAERLVRIQSKYENYRQSVETRLGTSGKKLTPDQRTSISETWHEGMRRAAAKKAGEQASR